MDRRNLDLYPHSSTWSKVIKKNSFGDPMLVNYYTNIEEDELLFQHVFIYDADGDFLKGGVINVKDGSPEMTINNPIFN